MDNQQGPTVWHLELCSMLCGRLDGRGVWGRMDTCLYMAESLHRSPETITTLLISSTPNIKLKVKKKICSKKKVYFQNHHQSYIPGAYNDKWERLGDQAGQGNKVHTSKGLQQHGEELSSYAGGDRDPKWALRREEISPVRAYWRVQGGLPKRSCTGFKQDSWDAEAGRDLTSTEQKR